jgi:signal transduction histidine kinase/ligand-binding sensor domain-containing protein
LARVSAGKGIGAVQLLPATDPLAANSVVALLEDREGDLWVGTETAGLHVLRDARFRTVGTSEGLSSDATTAIVQDGRDGLWIGTRESGLNHVLADSLNGAAKAKRPPAGIRTLTTANGLVSDVVLALATAANGDVWVGTPDGLNRVKAGTNSVQTFTSADGLPDDFIRSLLVAPDDSLWIGTRRGLTHMERGGFHNYSERDGLGSDLVGALARTSDGDLWIATLNGLSRMHEGRLRNFTAKDGLSSNVITALDVTSDGVVWIGTQGDGLNVWNGQRLMAVRGAQLPKVVHAISHDDRGHLWLATDAGLSRADARALMGCVGGQGCGVERMHLVNFSTADGLRSRETSSNSHPTACRTSDGQLWFSTPRGVIVVDPMHFAEMPSAPPVAIERFAVDDRESAPGAAALRIAAGHMRFQFDYAGLSFAAPQKLRYQYMLEGFDKSWTDAGTRRTAYYTNIPPGSYRFRVRAALGDGSFASGGDSEADLAFDLLPHFYQTVWFRALLVIAAAGLLVLVFRRRVLRVEREFRAVMAERNRIAREIHDTLAQGYVGISLQLEILGELLRHNRADAAAKHLVLTQGLVREGLNDARQSIWALRSQDAGEHTLPVRLRRAVEQAQSAALSANLEVHGAYRALTAETEQEIVRIGQEAIQNVKRHAQASELHVRLDYDERLLVLSVSDDGKGFVVRTKAREGDNGNGGHYGLTGMKERAALIRGQLDIESAPGQGTTVRLKVQAPEVSRRDKTDSDESADSKLEHMSEEKS